MLPQGVAQSGAEAAARQFEPLQVKPAGQSAVVPHISTAQTCGFSVQPPSTQSEPLWETMEEAMLPDGQQ